jgi:hypothetical protein
MPAVSVGDSEPAVAGVLTQRLAERRRLEPSLKLGDPFLLSLGLPVHRVLKTLQELLQMRDSIRQESKLRVLQAGRRGWLWACGRRVCGTTDLPDPSDQPLALA